MTFKQPPEPVLALQHIKRLQLPATPKYYEVWYAYASGLYPSLTKRVDQILSERDTLSDADIKTLYQTYLFSTTPEQIDALDESFSLQMKQLASLIGDASAASRTKISELAGAVKNIDPHNPEALKLVMASLLEASKQAQQTGRALQSGLRRSKVEIGQLKQRIEQVRIDSNSDALTKVFNRKYFDKSLEHMILSKTYPLSLLMVDIDHFKQFNDRHGHQTGDEVLRLVGHTLKSNFKGRDVVARYGGEEFAVILPDTTLKSAAVLADQVCRELAQREVKKRKSGEKIGRITLSIGVSTLRFNDTPHTLIERADALLYQAKRLGRNRVGVEADQKRPIAV